MNSALYGVMLSMQCFARHVVDDRRTWNVPVGRGNPQSEDCIGPGWVVCASNPPQTSLRVLHGQLYIKYDPSKPSFRDISNMDYERKCFISFYCYTDFKAAKARPVSS